MPQRAMGRLPDQSFVDDERLFRRYRPNDLVDGKLAPASLAIPKNSGPSFVREKYAIPEDVLHPDCAGARDFSGWGIFALRVGDIPPQLPPDVPTHRFWPQHVPLEDCYAHTEIWCNRIGQGQTYQAPNSATLKTLFRAMVSQHLKIVREPQ